jgi:hypothetical protein
MTDYPRNKTVEETTVVFNSKPSFQVSSILMHGDGTWHRVKSIDSETTLTTKRIGWLQKWLIIIWGKMKSAFWAGVNWQRAQDEKVK